MPIPETQLRLKLLWGEIEKSYEQYLKLPGHGRRALSEHQSDFIRFLQAEWEEAPWK